MSRPEPDVLIYSDGTGGAVVLHFSVADCSARMQTFLAFYPPVRGRHLCESDPGHPDLPISRLSGASTTG